MIDNYQKELMLRNAGYDQSYLDTLQGSQLSHLFYEEIGEVEMINTVKVKGEHEGDLHRIWLDNLNGVCNLDGHTDIMSAVVCKNTAGKDCLSIQVNTPNDYSTTFCSIDELNYDVVDKIYDQIMNYKN